MMLSLAVHDSLTDLTGQPAVRAALRDLRADLGAVFGRPPEISGPDGARVRVLIDPSVGPAESWTRFTDADGVILTGADILGAVYALYSFSRDIVGVDPLYFWRDVVPPRRDALPLVPGLVRSRPAVFRFRGWFLNDEDLLSEWKSGGGSRLIDYPFYAQIMAPEVAERVFETVLRCGCNLIIPASFVDIKNPPERALIERAVARGLYVSQHHVEPLGVSHFAYETYWLRKGRPKLSLSYRSDPDRARATWQDYARTWHEVAGDRVVWQLGLRGRGDRPVWHNDPGVREGAAGALISAALRDQMEILRKVTGQDAPPATLTLWIEGSQLMARGQLEVPEGVTLVFCDNGASQNMQADFHNIPRAAHRLHGSYYHVAFWGLGPHLAPGVAPARIADTYAELIAKGDKAYTIVNVANIREHATPLAAWSQIVREGAAWSESAFWREHVRSDERDLWQRYFAAILSLRRTAVVQGEVLLEDSGYRTLTDGPCRHLGQLLLEARTLPGRPFPEDYFPLGAESVAEALDAFRAAEAEFRSVASAAGSTGTGTLAFFAATMAELYAYVAALTEALSDDTGLERAKRALDAALSLRPAYASGRWRDWYRGDVKINLNAMAQTITLAACRT